MKITLLSIAFFFFLACAQQPTTPPNNDIALAYENINLVAAAAREAYANDEINTDQMNIINIKLQQAINAVMLAQTKATSNPTADYSEDLARADDLLIEIREMLR